MNTSTKIGLGPTPHPRRLQVGDLTLTFLDGGELWLDGGAMFGIIPKPMWAKGATVDEANRIPLAMTCTLVESGGKRILVETGCGAASKYSDKEQGFFRFGSYTIVDSLAAIGLEPEAIDIVILTHLHFDHAGGGTTADSPGPSQNPRRPVGDSTNQPATTRVVGSVTGATDRKGDTGSSSASADTRNAAGGNQGATGSLPASANVRDVDTRVVYRPTFPRAKYIVQRGEWDDAVSGHVVMTGTYRPENLAPLEAAGVLSFVNGEADIAPGIAVRPMVGHTRHQQGVIFYAGAKNPFDAGTRILSRTKPSQESLPAAGARIPSRTHPSQESVPAGTPTEKSHTWERIPPEAGARTDSRTSDSRASDAETHCAILPGDMIPTAAHLGLRHNMAYDLLPYENMVNKEALLRQVAHTGATLLLGQDPGCPAWRVEENAGRYNATKLAVANDGLPA